MPLDGESVKQIVYMIAEDPVPTEATLPVPAASTRDCCSDFYLKVFASTTDSDEYKNDRNGFLWWFKDIISSATIYLQKEDCTSGYTNVATLNTNDYGTFYALGFDTNDNDDNYIGYQLNWRDVLSTHGQGNYRIKCDFVSTLGNGSKYSNEFQLIPYSAGRINGTVRIEYWLNNYIGDNNDDYAVRDFLELNWYNSIRIPGVFRYNSSPYDEETIQYENGQINPVTDVQKPDYELKTKYLPFFVHDLLRTDILQADTIKITDYNANNTKSYIKKEVRKAGEFRPDWKGLVSRLAPVTIKFYQGVNNLRRKRC